MIRPAAPGADRSPDVRTLALWLSQEEPVTLGNLTRAQALSVLRILRRSIRHYPSDVGAADCAAVAGRLADAIAPEGAELRRVIDAALVMPRANGDTHA